MSRETAAAALGVTINEYEHALFLAANRAGQEQERDRIMALVEKLAQPTSDKDTMTIDRTELLKAILAK